MQPINYGVTHQSYMSQGVVPQGYPQMGYPIYPNCFDQLTTHGIVAEDVVGYITDTPSPYLQNYVAQRGWAPSLPGQVLPDPLPTLQPPNPLPKGDVYQTVQPKHPDANTFVKKNKYDTAKKVALGILLTGLAVLGIVRGKDLISRLRGTPPTPPPAGTTGPTWYQKIGTSIKNGLNAVGTFFKDLWNKIFHRTPATP